MKGRWRDSYTDRARALGYEARSVFKLEEIQRRTGIIRPRTRVVDLGCFPGSWSRYLLRQGVSRLVGVDLKAPEGLPGGVYLAEDVFSVEAERVLAALGGRADLVLSDMAPFTTGTRFADSARQIVLARRALELATQLLAPGGGFVVKVFDGEETPAFFHEVRALFAEIRRIRPEAVREASVEFFLVATRFSAPSTAPSPGA